jgi:tetratricopeptide (TPR) repeat protein
VFASKISQPSSHSNNHHKWLTEIYALFMASALICFSPNVIAHTDLSDRIDVLNHKIERNPESLKLYMERGRVFRLRGNYQSALEDFQLAAKLALDNIEVRYELGLVLLKLGDLIQALSKFDFVLKDDSKHHLALMNRARVFHAMEDYKNAASDYMNALNTTKSPKPEDYIEITNNYIDYGSSHYAKALSVLDVAIEKLGVLVQLQSRAIDIDLLTKNYQSALQRVDSLLATMKRKEKWLVTKAEILLLMGKPIDAKNNYRLALKSIERLPVARRNVMAIKNLEMKIKKALLELKYSQ